jgi:hypothetical protein
MLQPMIRLGILADFQMNKAFIAKNLCEKKAIKKNTCQGKCHLKKQLATASESEKKANATEKSNPEKQIQQNILGVQFIPFEANLKISHTSQYNLILPESIPDVTFHPPANLI